MVRIEDIDPPREQAGATESILQSLQAHGLLWDENIVFQSQRTLAYQTTINKLEQQGFVYNCSCSRKKLRKLNGICDRQCRQQNTPTAKRLIVDSSTTQLSHLVQFTDHILGPKQENLAETCGHFIIHRKDGLFAYQLAVVVDDIEQGITDIVRGDDLFSSTARQIYLTKLLGQKTANYAHIPVIVDNQGNKLSKQSHAPPINDNDAAHNLVAALNALNICTPTQLNQMSLNEILSFGLQHFHLEACKK